MATNMATNMANMATNMDNMAIDMEQPQVTQPTWQRPASSSCSPPTDADK